MALEGHGDAKAGAGSGVFWKRNQEPLRSIRYEHDSSVETLFLVHHLELNRDRLGNDVTRRPRPRWDLRHLREDGESQLHTVTVSSHGILLAHGKPSGAFLLARLFLAGG